MSIQYKNQSIALSTTNLTTVLTISTSAIAIVKSCYFSNGSTGTILCNASVYDSSSTTNYEFFRDNVLSSSVVKATVQGLNLEAGDAIKAQAATANELTVVCNYALINRENENG